MVRFTDDGGEPSGEGLAPVIPLFGARTAATGLPVVERGRRDDTPTWRSTWRDEPNDDDEALGNEDDALGDEDDDDACGAIEREIAERNLMRRLRTRQLSVFEARVVVAERAIGPDDVESILDDFRRRGYLDDASLAEQLIHVGVDRKGQGRQVIGQTLAKRGIPRDVADAALAALPDDDAERALQFARAKARSMSATEPQAALRRLAGQLARRGYSSSAALSAARQALDEERLEMPSHSGIDRRS